MQVAPTYRRTKQGRGLRSNEITRLEAQLEAQAAQSSLLHSRLTSTQDAMDDLKLSHQREIAVHKKSSANAREKLQRFMEYASSVEQERDDCRDALLTLVQKVEEHSDLATWPHSRIRLPEFLEPIHNESSSQPNVNAGPQEIAVGEQAKAITLWLRAELEKERMSHARTHEQAEREILALRAQLAQRDAELEACVVHRDHAALVNAAVPCNQDSLPHEVPTDDKSHRPISALTPEDAVEILGLRVAKNRELDSEIKQLSQKLHQARMKDPTYLHIEEPVPTPQGLAGQRTPQSPDLRPLSPQDCLSPYAMTPRYTSTPRAPAPSGDLPPRPPSIASESTVKGALTEIQKLEDEVRHLAASIDVLETQRRSTRSLVAQTLTRLPSAPAPRDAPDDVSSQHTAVRHEPDRPVPDTAAALRVELDDVRRGAAQRERELLAEVERLQEELSRRVFGAAPAVGSLLDEDDAERATGLRSPLAPVAVVWARSGDTATTTSDHVRGRSRPPVATSPPPNAVCVCSHRGRSTAGRLHLLRAAARAGARFGGDEAGGGRAGRGDRRPPARGQRAAACHSRALTRLLSYLSLLCFLALSRD
ncbi:hypothetical protein PHLGIDRAFT_276238 [Phlebiopsis gigantea 11061_1 CR5-6]|uniref:Uncharacterized protein n=1 Tax=Phlebiopsis gigantea (strain 11061_1 CR5-6) TaxID=745531 RepID=A0A0C3S490_PHLG1|nr:hypothetical protein PHLGIDRAFT_276238 [Phlebiopsis gigantea 11061_1 CR5-6]